MNTIFLDKATDIDVNISKHPITDDMEIVSSERAILQHIELLLMRDEYAILYQPGVCAGLRSLLFEQFGHHEHTIVTEKIVNSLQFEPRIDVTDIILTHVPDDNELLIEIQFVFLHTDRTLVYKSSLRRIL